MLQYPATFLFAAIFAAMFGFGAMGGWGAELAQVLFYSFMGMFLLSFILNGPVPLNPAPFKSGKGSK